MENYEDYQTLLVQEVGDKTGAISPSITPSASYGYENSKEAEGIFDGSVKKPLYARVGKPTGSKLENLLAKMDSGAGAIATSSGMSAISLATLSLLAVGDEVISIGGLFGGTFAYFDETLRRFGIKTSFFDVEQLDEIELAINEKTKIVFLESVGNPNLRLPNLVELIAIANKKGIAVIVDNTTTPISIQPLKLGADIIVYSTTKSITGNASALGGAVIFRAIKENDKFKNTKRYPFLEPIIKKMGKTALIANGKKRAMRDFGMSANAIASYLTILGLDTLAIRLERVTKTVEKVAFHLYSMGVPVRHPSLPNHEHLDLYRGLFKKGCGPLLTFDFGTKEKAFAFLDNSKLITITANIGDNRTLGLHMASTIYSDFTKEDREFLGITDGLIRISIGLESADDLIEDFLNALKV